MNLLQLINKAEAFIAQWAGTTMPRIVVVFLGLLICVWIGMAIWEKRIRILGAVAGIVLGLFMVVIAIDPRILRFLADTSFLARIRIMMIVLSFLVVIITVEAIRRSRLQERYAILWVTTGVIILMTAFFPHILDLFGFLLGTQYVTSVVGIVFTFLLLIAFHFSIALSGMQKRQTNIAQRCAILEAKLEELTNQVAALTSDRKQQAGDTDEGVPICEKAFIPVQGDKEKKGKSEESDLFKGTRICSLIVIAASFAAVLLIGIMTPQAMIGDEVTHYYMLVNQSKNLSQPNFYAHIPTGWGDEEIRRYPHSCLWHYMGAMAYRLTGGSFFAVQVYHALFWLQFLYIAFLLAGYNREKISYAPALYLLVLASLPVSLIFSVAFYQDIPMAAQVLTAFYLLRKRRWFWASIFMALAIGMKISALLFLPAFFILMGWWEHKAGTWRNATAALLISAIILGSFTWSVGWALNKYAGAGFYPVEQLQKIAYGIKDRFGVAARVEKTGEAPVISSKSAEEKRIKAVTLYEAKIIANHPGDLRIPENFLIYGGGILWLAFLAGVFSMCYSRYKKKNQETDAESGWWIFGVGISYIITTAYFIRTAPDARFFLPGIPFVLLPFVCSITRLPRINIIIAVTAALAILQGGQVLKKTYTLRNISGGLKDAIAYLQKNPVSPPRIFMYPEGNYRLFPYAHEWYLEYRLREFWKGDNDIRIEMLRQNNIGAMVIKKHLISEVDDAITNLGVYPIYFVRDVERDRRFLKLFENNDVIIFKTP
jgi:hypothetical protein